MLELLRRYSGITVNYCELSWITLNYCELLELQWITRNYLDFLLYFLTGLQIFQLGYLIFLLGYNFLTGASWYYYWVLLRLCFLTVNSFWITLNCCELLWITVNYSVLLWIGENALNYCKIKLKEILTLARIFLIWGTKWLQLIWT
jgi:hypothetical protein